MGVDMAGHRRPSTWVTDASASLLTDLYELTMAAGHLDAASPRARRPSSEVVFAGDLDEHRVRDLVEAGAPIDSFGVGTRMGTSGDAPSLEVVYKLVADPSGPRMKRSAGKVTIPGCKQIVRHDDHDLLALHDEPVGDGRPLLHPVLGGGVRVADAEPLEVARARAAAAVASLPPALRSLAPAGAAWEVRVSDALATLQRDTRQRWPPGHDRHQRRGG